MNKKIARLFVAAAVLFLIAGCGMDNNQESQKLDKRIPEKVTFNKDIRPIFSKICFTCHGPDKHNNPSELRLDVREMALTKLEDQSLAAITPFKPEESQLIHRIRSSDPNVVMPPPDFKHRLNEYEKQLLERWIEQGTTWSAPVFR